MNLFLDDDSTKASLVMLLRNVGHQVVIPLDDANSINNQSALSYQSENGTPTAENAGRGRHDASFETNPRVANAKDVSHPQRVFVDPLAIHEGAAGTLAIREHGLLVDQYHLAMQHGNVGVFQPGRGTHVAADEEQLLLLEGKNKS
jgi:hypothetical protein